VINSLLLALQITRLTPAPAQDSAGYRLLLRFPVTDTTPVFERALSRTLLVQVRHEGDAEAGGWSIAVIRRPAGPERHNLLYHSRAWHGPYPTDLLAWIHEEHYYPDERVLPVYDYPYELRFRCEGCETMRTARGVKFTAGTVQVDWRRTRAPARRD
jgi:hypothetical protein